MRFGIIIGALAFATALLAAMTAAVDHGIDRSVILRFIAPTAFETRSIEEILEGGGP